MKRTTRAQSKRNAVVEAFTLSSFPNDLPAPSTSRNSIPRSRATSLARSASRSLSRSRGSSRRSSLSGSRLGNSNPVQESSLTEVHPPAPGGTISGGRPVDIAYSRGDSQIPGSSLGAEVLVEGTYSTLQSQAPSSDSTTLNQQPPSRIMIPNYGFNGGYSGQGERTGSSGNTLQGNTHDGWNSNFDGDDIAQQPGFFPFNDADDAFAMRQNLALGLNPNPNTTRSGPSTEPPSSYTPQLQTSTTAAGGTNGYYAGGSASGPPYSFSVPLGYSSPSSYQQQEFYAEVPPSQQDGREVYLNNNSTNYGCQPPRTVHPGHTFDPFTAQEPMNIMASTNHQSSAQLGTAGSAIEDSMYQQEPAEASGSDPYSNGYHSNFSSLAEWQTIGESSQHGGTSASTSAGSKRKRSPELASPSSHANPSFPSSQGSSRIDSDNEVAEQLLYGLPYSHLDDNPAGTYSQENVSMNRKGKEKAREQTPITEESIIDITDSPPLERYQEKAQPGKSTSPVQSGKQPADPLSSYTCPICFSPPTNATITPCGHICCGACLFAAVKTTLQRATFGMARPPLSEARCPVCRATIPGWDGKGGGVIGLKVRAIFSL